MACPASTKGPAEPAQGSERSSRPARPPRPPSLLPLGMNHVYKL
jgi:hypothetical protein